MTTPDEIRAEQPGEDGRWWASWSGNDGPPEHTSPPPFVSQPPVKRGQSGRDAAS